MGELLLCTSCGPASLGGNYGCSCNFQICF